MVECLDLHSGSDTDYLNAPGQLTHLLLSRSLPAALMVSMVSFRLFMGSSTDKWDLVHTTSYKAKDSMKQRISGDLALNLKFKSCLSSASPSYPVLVPPCRKIQFMQV